MDINANEQTGYTGTDPNDILKFKDWNPINRGTIDAMNNIGKVRAKDAQGIRDVLDLEDEEIENDKVLDNEEENDELVINSKPEIGKHHWSHPYGFVGAPMAIGNSLSESLGVPDDIEPWVDLLYAFIKNQIYIFTDTVNGTDDYNEDAEINGKSFISKSLVFNVRDKEFDDYIKEYIPTDNKLKVKRLNIDLGLSSIPDELFTFDSWNASFSDSDATIKKGYFTNTKFSFELFLPESLVELETADQIDYFLDNTDLGKKIFEFLSHELTHMYEYYHRKLNKVEVWKDRMINTNKFVVEKQLLSNVSDDWKGFLNLIYLSLDFEINARISQLFYSLAEVNPNTKYDFIDEVKKSSVWDEMMSLKEFDADRFYENFTYKSSDEDLKSVFKSLDLYTDEELEEANMKDLLLKELIKLWDKNIDHTNKLYDSGEMTKLSPFYINNPMVFIRKFGNRFHRKAKIFERKIYRLSSKFDLD